ncbi:lipid-transfer protein [Parasphingopyxis sp.]|uniref:thiolase C-terminal domain-containing protein n=1 Tax=Parasphingopyxis sp. TaxID=1920299 RepID=UPI002639D1EC|nr:lipid-transfer protein [Parasphingopyxis sp.]
MDKAIVAGVDMVKFVKPGTQEPFRVMAANAIRGALADAGLESGDVQQAYASYIYGDSTCGQLAMYDAIDTGIPMINVNNACASGSTAIYMARQAVESGVVDCALAFGFEEMQPGAIDSAWTDREAPIMHTANVLKKFGYPDGPGAVPYFAAAGDHYLKKYDAKPDIFAKVAVKTRSHAIHNPYSLFTKPLTVDEVMGAPVIYLDYITRYMACPPTCGAAAAIIVSPAFAKKHDIGHGVEIVAQTMATDTPASWDNPMNAVGADMARRASGQLYEQTGFGPEAAQVVELHDCFTMNEVVTYEAIGLCAEGEATKFIEDGDNSYGGQYVVNPSGGLMSKGHPIGATGLAQCFELVQQLRGAAGDRQVPDARIALQHNLGLSGAVVMTFYQAAS